MSRFILDITDSQIALISGSSIIQSPGAALACGSDKSHSKNEAPLAFGQTVFEALKRRPLETRTDFWAQLSTVPLNTDFAGARHSADLAYEHLKSIFSDAEREIGTVNDLAIIVPSSMSQGQLELLLGIFNAVGKPASAILDRSLVHQYLVGNAGVHLDLQWRQMVATEVKLRDGQLEVGKSTTLPGNGYLDLLEQCLEHCADMCVEQTRFDPRRSADAEQLLFNAIPNLLATLTNSEEAALSVSGYDFKVSRTGIEFIGKRLMAAVKGISDSVSVDKLLASLPGIQFDSTATQTNLAQAADRILNDRDADSPLSRIASATVKDTLVANEVREPEKNTTSSEASAPAHETFEGPTHVLINSRAYSIFTQSLEARAFGLIVEGDRVRVAEDFQSEVNVLSTESTFEQLHAGCRLYRNDGTEALLIRVEG